jgi:5-methylthioadenosine/S-adenosylhomocysteine deaminase
VTSLDESVGDLTGGDVLIEGDTITAVGHDLDAPGATVVDAAGKIVIPGLVDAHRHVWQGVLGGGMSAGGCFGPALAELPDRYEPEDVYAGVLWGALQAIDSGITTVGDWSHIITTPAHADENVRALEDSGIRALFLYGPPIGEDVMKWFVDSTVRHPADVERMRREVLSDDTARITMGLALRGPEFSTLGVTEADFWLARELGVPISIHSGLPAYLGRSPTIETLHRLGLLGPDVHHAHGSQFTGRDLDRIAATGGSVVPCPTADMAMAKATGSERYPITGRAIAHGLLPALGTDTATGATADLFSEMRTALAAERHRPASIHLTPRDVLRFTTIAGAAALGLSDRVGTISPGKRADLVLLDAGRPAGSSAPALVLASDRAAVDTVVVDGRILKRDGHLLGPAAEQARALVEASRHRLLTWTSLSSA